MSVLGNNITPANISIVTDTGDGSDTGVTLTKDLGSDNNYLVFVDGIKQDDWSRSGTALTFTTAPPNGADIEVYQFGERLDINTPADNTVDYNKVTNGAVVQVVHVQDGTAKTAALSGSTLMNLDNTIPQNTEGMECMTLAITPRSATNKLMIQSVLHLDTDVVTSLTIAALFQDSTANALSASFGARDPISSRLNQISFTHFMTAGTIAETTFKVRAGIVTAGDIHFNETQAGVDLFGGVLASSITITEIKA